MEEMKEDIEFVDLGLPSGTLWATKNVGAQEVYSCGELMRKPQCEEHLPTYEQCKELIEQCDFSVVMIQGEGDMMYPCVRVEGSNGNCAFFPGSSQLDEAMNGLAVSVWCGGNKMDGKWAFFMLFHLSQLILGFYELTNITIGMSATDTLKMVRYVKKLE